jgi:hypothetical protein
MAECEPAAKAMRLDPDSPFVDWFRKRQLSAASRFDNLYIWQGARWPVISTCRQNPAHRAMLEATGRSDEAEKLYQQGRHGSQNLGLPGPAFRE